MTRRVRPQCKGDDALHDECPGCLCERHVQWTYKLPLPPADLTPNSGGTHSRFDVQGHARATREYRMIAFGEARKEGVVRPPRPLPCYTGRIKALICRKTLGTVAPLYARAKYRALDPLNLAAAMKPVIDGLVDAGVLAGDRWTIAAEWRIAIGMAEDWKDEAIIVTVQDLAV